MFALVDKSDNSITKMYNGNKGITLGDNQYPRAIFSLWTEAERNAINIYTITIDESKSCLLYTSPSPRDPHLSRMPSSA